MNINTPSYKRAAGCAAAIVLFFLIAALYFAPQFSGQTLMQHDVQQYEGMSKDILDNRAATGEDAQWTGRMFGGMPAFLINVKYPAQAVKGTIGKIVKVVDTPASFLFFSMTAMWIAMLLFGLSPWVGLVAALAYGFSTYFMLIIGAGHITKMWALVYAPLMMAGVYCTLRRNAWAGAALTALFTSLEIGANHPQITYYFVIAMAALWISEGIIAMRSKRGRDFARRTALLVAAGVAAVGSNFAPLWYTWQHTKETTRGGSELVAEGAHGDEGLDLQYATAWSYGKTETLNTLVPDFMGGASSDTFAPDGPVADALRPYGMEQAAQYMPRYWGDQPYTAGPTYLGAAVIFLALTALFLLPARQRWWIVAATLLTLFMAWGSNMMWLTELLMRYLPGYNKFRTVSMALVVAQWTLPLLAALGTGIAIERSEQTDLKRLTRAVIRSAAICAALLLILIAGGRSLFDFGMQHDGASLSEQFRQMLLEQGGDEYVKQGAHESMGWSVASAMADERAAVMRADAWRSLAFIILAAGAMLLYARRKVIRSGTALCIVLTLIVAADLVTVDTRYLSWKSFVPARTARILPTEADKLIMQDKDPAYRVLNTSVSTFNDATTSYFHRSVGGYHGAKLSRYQDIIDRYLSKGDEGVLDMLNVRYVIGPSATADDVATRPAANGAAWTVRSVVRAASPEEEITLTGQVDTKHEAVMSDEFLPENYNFTDGTVTLEEYRPNYLRYTTQSEGNALAVFSEIYTREGWRAYIDGEEVRPLRADYILRALELPAGSHTVEWRYRAPHWNAVEAVTLIFSIAVLAAFIITVITVIRNERRQTTEA